MAATFLLAIALPVKAAELRIAAAGSLRFVLPSLIGTFENAHPEIRVSARYGASGHLARQLARGAPDNVFLSADLTFAALAASAGGESAEPVLYGRGRLVFFRSKRSTLPEGLLLRALEPDTIERLAIAQPEHAPYGKAAKAALTTLGLWDGIQAKLVFGENVAQAAQFAATGHADAALIGQSQAMALSERGDWTGVELGDQTVLDHYLVRMDAQDEEGKLFEDFLLSAAADKIWRAHGFLPGEH